MEGFDEIDAKIIKDNLDDAMKRLGVTEQFITIDVSKLDKAFYKNERDNSGWYEPDGLCSLGFEDALKYMIAKETE